MPLPRVTAVAAATLLVLVPTSTQAAPAQPTRVAPTTQEPAAPGAGHVVDPPLARLAPDPAPRTAARGAGPSSADRAPLVPLDQTFSLHSDPGSERTIFLDFDGVSLSGTYWNDPDGVGPGAQPDGSYTGYSENSDPALSDGERERIQQVWQMVSQKFAAFDVDVTTEEQGPSVYTRDDPLDPTYGVRVAFSADPAVRPRICSGCGGVARLGYFDQVEAVPGYSATAWVFGGQANPTSTAQAAAHEVGHTLGLSHDGKGADEYYDGQGPTSPVLWTPVMGAGLGPIQQFSNGDYDGATNREDDFARFVDHGLPRRYDDAGGTVAAATTLGARSSYDVDALITSRTDVDVWEVSHPCTADLAVRATTAGLGSPLDLQASVLDASGRVLGSGDPAAFVISPGGFAPRLPGGTDAAVTVPAPAGTYYVRVDGVGSGTATTGYSDYGSIGTYRLEVSGCDAATAPAPGAPTSLDATFDRGTAVLRWTAPAPATGVTGYRITGVPGGPVEVGGTTTSLTVRGVPGGQRLRPVVVALGAAGASAPTAASFAVPRYAPTAAPTLQAKVTGRDRVDLTWTPAANPGNAVGVGWRISGGNSRYAFTGTLPYALRGSLPFLRVPPGSYRVTLTPQMTADQGVAPARTVDVLVGGAPSAPRAVKAASGARGKPLTARVRWTAPAIAGAGPVTGYQVVASKIGAGGRTVRTLRSKQLGARTRSYSFALQAGRYRFRVVARNRYLVSPPSALTTTVAAR